MDRNDFLTYDGGLLPLDVEKIKNPIECLV
jgi:hypothetical protein